MSVSKYFVPECVLPLYFMGSESTAHNCGVVSGTIYASIITLLTLLLIFRIYTKVPDPNERMLYYKIIGIALGVCWIILPVMAWFSYGNMWKGYQQVMSYLQAEGYSQITSVQILAGIDGNNSGLVNSTTATSDVTPLVLTKKK
jgi:hypothetical protein